MNSIVATGLFEGYEFVFDALKVYNEDHEIYWFEAYLTSC